MVALTWSRCCFFGLQGKEDQCFCFCFCLCFWFVFFVYLFISLFTFFLQKSILACTTVVSLSVTWEEWEYMWRERNLLADHSFIVLFSNTLYPLHAPPPPRQGIVWISPSCFSWLSLNVTFNTSPTLPSCIRSYGSIFHYSLKRSAKRQT